MDSSSNWKFIASGILVIVIIMVIVFAVVTKYKTTTDPIMDINLPNVTDIYADEGSVEEGSEVSDSEEENNLNS